VGNDEQKPTIVCDDRCSGWNARTLRLSLSCWEWRGGDTSSPAESTPNGDADQSGTDGLPALPGESIDDFESLNDWIAMIDGGGTLEAGTDDPYGRIAVGSPHRERGHGARGDLQGRRRIGPARFEPLARREVHRPRAASTLARAVCAELAKRVRAAANAHRTVRSVGTRRLRHRSDRGEPDLTDVSEIRLTARRRGDTSGSIDCQVDDLRVVDRPATGKVMLLFDGMLESHYAEAFERMEPYGYAARRSGHARSSRAG